MLNVKSMEIWVSKAASCVFLSSRLHIGYSNSSSPSCKSASTFAYSYALRRGVTAQFYQLSNRYITTDANDQQGKSSKSSSKALTSQEYGGGSAVSTTLKEKGKQTFEGYFIHLHVLTDIFFSERKCQNGSIRWSSFAWNCSNRLIFPSFQLTFR